MDEIEIREFRADDAQWLVDLHGVSYARDEGFDDSFGALVEQILSDFVSDHDPTRERGWIAERAGTRLGSIFCVVQGEQTAKLRLFLLVPEARGQGLGKRLLNTCMGFARDVGYKDMQLWTHESHAAACALYRASGWQLTGSKPVRSFGVDLVEQSWRIQL
ncbi:GNAT family N-acetyltransferase [Ruegeria sp.]|uniref:GNAT family N-acetyltransferase n=1 Tax=Ruegeria sp. TaxID=1879320 RepID=UPI003C7C6C17